MQSMDEIVGRCNMQPTVANFLHVDSRRCTAMRQGMMTVCTTELFSVDVDTV